jgi:hypothetical protein
MNRKTNFMTATTTMSLLVLGLLALTITTQQAYAQQNQHPNTEGNGVSACATHKGQQTQQQIDEFKENRELFETIFKNPGDMTNNDTPARDPCSQHAPGRQ